MKTMTNPQEWLTIQMTHNTTILSHTTSNFTMRQYISSYGFRAPRELAQEILNMIKAWKK